MDAEASSLAVLEAQIGEMDEESLKREIEAVQAQLATSKDPEEAGAEDILSFEQKVG